MSNLAEHMDEQDEIAALCEAGECDHPECHQKEFTVLLGVTVRAYGHATVTASSAEEAAEIVRSTADQQTGPWDSANDPEWSTACEATILHIETTDGEVLAEDLALYPDDDAHAVIDAATLAELIKEQEE